MKRLKKARKAQRRAARLLRMGTNDAAKGDTVTLSCGRQYRGRNPVFEFLQPDPFTPGKLMKTQRGIPFQRVWSS